MQILPAQAARHVGTEGVGLLSVDGLEQRVLQPGIASGPHGLSVLSQTLFPGLGGGLPAGVRVLRPALVGALLKAPEDFFRRRSGESREILRDEGLPRGTGCSAAGVVVLFPFGLLLGPRLARFLSSLSLAFSGGLSLGVGFCPGLGFSLALGSGFGFSSGRSSPSGLRRLWSDPVL